MNSQEIKKKMMGLWENVFHDSKDYISLVFENYFNENYIEYHEHEGRIVSALLGVPYEFGCGRYRLKGLYLCGLATSENFRQKGLMTELLEKINRKCEKEFDFTFLIPSSDLMADYYHHQGYFNSFYRTEERYTSVHDFKNDFLISLSETDERIRNLKINLFEEIKIKNYNFDLEFETDLIDFIQTKENKSGRIVNLLHSEKDLKAVLKENEISGGSIFVSFDNEDKITGVAFTVKEEIKRIGIPVIYVNDSSSYFALLNHIKCAYPDYSISLYKSSETSNVQPSLIEQGFIASNPDGGDLDSLFGLAERPYDPSLNMQPYGMVKLLRYDRIIEFIGLTQKDVEFKIELKDWPYENEGESQLYIVDHGKVKLEKSDNKDSKNILRLTSKEFSELLLRKKDTNSLIMEAFGIPRLILKMSLMLD